MNYPDGEFCIINRGERKRVADFGDITDDGEIFDEKCDTDLHSNLRKVETVYGTGITEYGDRSVLIPAFERRLIENDRDHRTGCLRYSISIEGTIETIFC